MVNLVTTIAKEICDDPDQVEVTEIEGKTASILEVRVAKTDLGKMIGRQGATAGAIRKIIYAASFKHHKRYNLEMLAHGE